jgi:xanthine phosphoribosyltransferase
VEGRRRHYARGLVPAAVVARELDIRIVETVCVVGMSRTIPIRPSEKVQLLKPAADVGDGEGWLVVDDLSIRAARLSSCTG